MNDGFSSEGSGFNDMAEFLMEGTMMTDCSHENVLGLIGTFFKDGRPYVTLPLMENGDLKTFISMPQNVNLQRHTFYALLYP